MMSGKLICVIGTWPELIGRVLYVHFPQSGVQSGAESGVRMQIDRNHLASH